MTAGYGRNVPPPVLVFAAHANSGAGAPADSRGRLSALRSTRTTSEERADVLAETFLHLDGEPALARNVEVSAGGVFLHGVLSVQGHAAGAGDDFHPLGRGGAEMVA